MLKNSQQEGGSLTPRLSPLEPTHAFAFLSYLLYFTECVVSFCVQSLWKEGINPK